MSLAFADKFTESYSDCSFIYETGKLKITDLNREFNILVVDTGKFTCHLNFPKLKKHASFTFAAIEDAVIEIMQIVKMIRLFRHLVWLFKDAYDGTVTMDDDWRINVNIRPNNRINGRVVGQIQNKATGYFWSSNFGCVGGLKSIGDLTHHILSFWPAV